MYIEKLRLLNFRNYKEQEIGFSEKGNVIIGENAQGKTNIIEAIYVCAVGKSHRAEKESELINFGENGYFIEINLKKKERNYKIEIGFNSNKEKRVKAGGVELTRIGELLGKLVVVMFSPDDLKIVKEGPAFRRRFLDILICQMKSAYLFDLQQYYRVLNQRNVLLKQIKEDYKKQDLIDVWDEKLAEFGSKIILNRLVFNSKIEEKAKKIHYNLTSNKEELKVKYICSFIKDIKDTNINIKKEFEEGLRKSRGVDVKRGFTGIGPHRDDIYLSIENLEAGKYGSQGQQRTAALSLKLAELEIFREEIEENPVLLLDDVFSELDEKRRDYLKDYIKDIQFFITSADENDLKLKKEGIKIIKIENGKILEL